MNRKDYMDGKVSHEDYYLALGDALGRRRIESLVHSLAQKEGGNVARTLKVAPLARWDAYHGMVVQLARENARAAMAISWPGHEFHGTVCWSLCETVCVLKASAGRIINEQEAACEKEKTQ